MTNHEKTARQAPPEPPPNIIQTEIHCHECQHYVQFSLNLGMNGNHVLTCPICQHEHCRVVKDGVVTDDRWASRNGNTYYVVPHSTSSLSLTFTNPWFTWSTSSIDSTNYTYWSE